MKHLCALCLVLLAALDACMLELSAKYAAESRHFVWLFSAGSVLVYGPIVIGIVLVEQPQFSAPLARARRDLRPTPSVFDHAAEGLSVSDLSVVYPIARGTGPLLSFIGAALLLGETPTTQSIARPAADRRRNPAGGRLGRQARARAGPSACCTG